MKIPKKILRNAFLTGAFFALPLQSQAYLNFTDNQEIPQWAKIAVEEMSEQKIITGFGDRSFRPHQTLNRAEAVTLLLRLKGLSSEKVIGKSTFGDVPNDAWYSKAVTKATQEGWIKGKPDGFFHPAAPLNRAEFSALITRAFDLNTTDIQTPEKPPKDIPTKAWFAPHIFALYQNTLVRIPQKIYYGPATEVSRAEAAWTFHKISTMPRLMGNSNTTDLSTATKIDSRRTAIRPKDFNPNKQSYDIQKEVLSIKASPKSDAPINLQIDTPWTHLGNLEVTNHQKEKSQLSTIELRLKFEKDGIGPTENFSGKISHLEIDRDASFAKNGDLLLTDVKLSLEPGQTKILHILIKANQEKSYYATSGLANLYLKNADAVTFTQFSRENNQRHASLKRTPIEITDRELSQIKFSPITTE